MTWRYGSRVLSLAAVASLDPVRLGLAREAKRVSVLARAVPVVVEGLSIQGIRRRLLILLELLDGLPVVLISRDIVLEFLVVIRQVDPIGIAL